MMSREAIEVGSFTWSRIKRTETMLGLITAWLTGEARCSETELADGLSRSSHAVLEAMRN